MAIRERPIRYYTLWDVDMNAWEEPEEVDHTREGAKIMLVEEDAAVWLQSGGDEIGIYPQLDEEEPRVYILTLGEPLGDLQELEDVEDALRMAEEYLARSDGGS